MRVVVIGATGHVGTYLVPRLVEAGHEVVAVSRGERSPYTPHAAWEAVRRVTLNRAAAETAGTFGTAIRDLAGDVVIDMICFSRASAQALVDALRGEVQHFLHCGTIWVHGHSVQVPTTEDQPRRPFGEYGVAKAQIEAYLLQEAIRGFPATILHPGHIVGPGWPPLNPAGHFDLSVFEILARGDELTLPNIGMETVHHVHADDVAQAFVAAITHRDAAVGQAFHVVSEQAMTLRGYAEAVAVSFGKEAKLRYMPWEQFRQTIPPHDAAYTWDHIAHSPNCSIAKAKRLVDYKPRYSSFDAVFEALTWLSEQGRIPRIMGGPRS